MAVLASSASAGLSSVKRVAAQLKERTRKEEERRNRGKIQKKKEEPQPQPLFPKTTGGLRDQSSPERNEKGVSKGNPLNR